MATDSSPSNPSGNGAKSSAGGFYGFVRGNAFDGDRRRHQVPAFIASRYQRSRNHYLFPDRTLAFIDEGDRLRVKTENEQALRDIVAIAQARGWKLLELHGTKTFRRRIWREAAQRDIAVHGYTPTQAEILLVQRALKTGHSTPQAGDEPPPPAASARRERSAPDVSVQSSSNAEPPPTGSTVHDAAQRRVDAKPPIRGILVEAAAAPYQFDRTQRMSFYVTVRTEAGKRTIWGADLERALAESTSRARVGDRVEVHQLGSRAVTVRVPTRNAQGDLTGEKKIAAQQTRWSIETAEHFRTLESHAERVRTGAGFSDEELSRHRELASAAAVLKLAEQFAHRVTADPASQLRLVQVIRERTADALARGKFVRLPARRTADLPARVRQTIHHRREEGHERV